MWIFFALAVFIAFILFNRFKRYSIPTPLAFVLSVGIVIAPFVLVPLILIWIIFKSLGFGRNSGSAGNRRSVKQTSFCPKCGMDLPEKGNLCPSCGNSVQVSG